MSFYPTPNVVPGCATTAQQPMVTTISAPPRAPPTTPIAKLGQARLQHERQEPPVIRCAPQLTCSPPKNNYFHQPLHRLDHECRKLGAASLDEVYTVNATNILNLRVSLTFMREHLRPQRRRESHRLRFLLIITPSRFHAPGTCPTCTSAPAPRTAASAPTPLSKHPPSTSIQLFGSWTRVQGDHPEDELRRAAIPAEHASRLRRVFQAASTSATTAGCAPNSGASSTVAMGQDMAQEFLLGLPDQGVLRRQADRLPGTRTTSRDSCRTTDSLQSNLTLNLGVRFDYNGPYNEKFGRTVRRIRRQHAESDWSGGDCGLRSASGTATARQHVRRQRRRDSIRQTAARPPIRTSHLVATRAWGSPGRPEKLHGKTVIRGFGSTCSSRRAPSPTCRRTAITPRIRRSIRKDSARRPP